jgi:hypothetical protein
MHMVNDLTKHRCHLEAGRKLQSTTPVLVDYWPNGAVLAR